MSNLRFQNDTSALHHLFYESHKNLITSLGVRTYRKENVFFAFKNVFERAFVSKKELNLIIGVFSKLSSYKKKEIREK